MSVPQSRKIIRKGASDLRSAAAARGAQLPHKTHMRLVCLEMERHRRQVECQSLLARAERCASRCREIDAEVDQLLASLRSRRAAVPMVPQGVRGPVRPATQPLPTARAAGSYRY